jgi:hypothetical protein
LLLQAITRIQAFRNRVLPVSSCATDSNADSCCSRPADIAVVFATMDLLDDPFSSQPTPQDTYDGSFIQFIAGLADEDVLDDHLLCNQPVASVPIPLPHTASIGPPEAPLDALEPLCVLVPSNDEPLPLASGASDTKSSRTMKTAHDRMEKLRAKNRRGQAKYREKCRVSASSKLLPCCVELCMAM